MRDAALTCIILDPDAAPPGVAYVLHRPGFNKHIYFGLILQQDLSQINCLLHSLL